MVEPTAFEHASLPFQLTGPELNPDLRVDVDDRAHVGELCAGAAPGSTVEITGRGSASVDELAQTLAAVWRLDCVDRVVVSE